MADDYKKFVKLNANVGKAIQVMLVKIATTASNTSKILAPYLSGNLRRSIGFKTDRLSQGIVVIGSPVKYARRREYENNLHPERKFYIKRGYTMNKPYFREIINQTLSKILD